MPTISRNYKSGGIESSEVDLNLYPRNTNGVVTPSAGLLNAPADLDPPLTISTNGTEDNYEQKAVDISGDTACRSYTTAFGWSPWLVQGTAAYADVQTSPTDTTADRLMAVGAFGVGATTNPVQFPKGAGNSILNQNAPNGFYRTTTPITDLPTEVGAEQNFMVMVNRWDSDDVNIQIKGTGTQRGLIFENSYRSSTGDWSGWQPVYTGANYQPNTANGIGVVTKMKNNSGGAINAGATVSGSLLNHYFIDAAGVSQQAGATGGTGTTWRNVSGSNVGNGNGVEFVRES